MASAGDRWTQKPQYRVGLLVLERKRDGFDVAWGKKTRGKCWEALVTICGNNGYASSRSTATTNGWPTTGA